MTDKMVFNEFPVQGRFLNAGINACESHNVLNPLTHGKQHTPESLDPHDPLHLLIYGHNKLNLTMKIDTFVLWGWQTNFFP